MLTISICNTDRIIVTNNHITHISAYSSYFIRKFSTGLCDNNIPFIKFEINWRILIKLAANFVSQETTPGMYSLIYFHKTAASRSDIYWDGISTNVMKFSYNNISPKYMQIHLS